MPCPGCLAGHGRRAEPGAFAVVVVLVLLAVVLERKPAPPA
jgi:hypothetical protein